MNITYDWKITALKKAPTLDGLSNVITHIETEETIVLHEPEEIRLHSHSDENNAKEEY